MKKTTILIIAVLFILAGLFVQGDSYMNYLTKGLADTLYCRLTGCTMQGDLDMNGYDILNTTIIQMNTTNATEICLNSSCILDWHEVNQSSSSLRYATVVVSANDSINPDDSDIRCDGIDDSACIQSAIALLPDDGGIVYLLEGNYLFQSQVNLSNNTYIQGSGFGTFLELDSAPRIFYAMGGNNIKLSNMQFDGGGNPTLRFHKSDSIEISNNLFNGKYPISLREGNSNILITHNTFDNCRIAIYTTDSLTTSIISNNFFHERKESYNFYTIQLTGSTLSNSISNNIFDCYSDTCDTWGILFTSSTNSNNMITDNLFADIRVAIGLRGDSNIVSHNNIHNTTIGIDIIHQLAGTDKNLISSNRIFSSVDAILVNNDQNIISNNLLLDNVNPITDSGTNTYMFNNLFNDSYIDYQTGSSSPIRFIPEGTLTATMSANYLNVSGNVEVDDTLKFPYESIIGGRTWEQLDLDSRIVELIADDSNNDNQLRFSKADGNEHAVIQADYGSDHFFIGLDTTDVKHNLIVGTLLKASDNYDHGSPTDPTLWIQSATDPDTDNTQWLSLHHDKSEGIINSGKGNVTISNLKTTILTFDDGTTQTTAGGGGGSDGLGNHTASQDLTMGSHSIIGDNTDTKIFFENNVVVFQR